HLSAPPGITGQTIMKTILILGGYGGTGRHINPPPPGATESPPRVAGGPPPKDDGVGPGRQRPLPRPRARAAPPAPPPPPPRRAPSAQSIWCWSACRPSVTRSRSPGPPSPRGSTTWTSITGTL